MRPDDEFLVRRSGFSHTGTECETIEVNVPWGLYTVAYVRVPEGHPDFGIDYRDHNFPKEYRDVCGAGVFTGRHQGDDWLIGFNTYHSWLSGGDTTMEDVIKTVKKLAGTVMKRTIG